jgi:hypothetical protein
MPFGTLDLFALPFAPNQTYCTPVELAPGLFADAYVPTALERAGVFSDFDGLLLDPFDAFAPFPGGLILVPPPPGGLFAWRIASTTAAVDPLVNGTVSSVTFSNAGAGTSSISTSSTGPTPPSGFSLGNPLTYYDITTTRVFSGDVTVCIDYSNISFANESVLKLFHFESGLWVDSTVSLDTDADIICGNVSSLSPFGIFAPEEVSIDIKPGSDPNSINCSNDNQVITVAILTTEDFDAITVDHTTVTFGGASETHVNRQSGELRRHEEDVDSDGDTDLVLHFRLKNTNLTCDSTQGTLTGKTFDGGAIEGTDSVRMVRGTTVITVGQPIP